MDASLQLQRRQGFRCPFQARAYVMRGSLAGERERSKLKRTEVCHNFGFPGPCRASRLTRSMLHRSSLFMPEKPPQNGATDLTAEPEEIEHKSRGEILARKNRKREKITGLDARSAALEPIFSCGAACSSTGDYKFTIDLRRYGADQLSARGLAGQHKKPRARKDARTNGARIRARRDVGISLCMSSRKALCSAGRVLRLLHRSDTRAVLALSGGLQPGSPCPGARERTRLD
jgi:hypothetical protein